MTRGAPDTLFDAPVAATAAALIERLSPRRKTRSPLPSPADRHDLQRLPRWTRCADETSPVAAAVASGAALLALDQIVKSNPPWLGALRMRQALLAATSSARTLSLREDEAELRDAHHLPSESPGPAGLLHRAWRIHASRPARADRATCDRLVEALGLPSSASQLFDDTGDPVTAAARTASATAAVFASRDGEVLGWMLGDVILATRLGWPVPVPLLATVISKLRLGPNGRRIRPGDQNWSLACHLGVARAAAEAHARALDLARRADRLSCIAQGVRTRHRAAAVKTLLNDDAVAATALSNSLGSERAARRFLSRLVELGAVRELTGRGTFRLYGL